jgi:diphthamide biosynthesis protein 3
MSTDSDENIYDVIEIEDLDFEMGNKTFYYPCPCGDKFAITLVSIRN